MERRETDIEHDPETGRVYEQRTVDSPGVPPAESEVVSTFNPGWRAVQLVYLSFGVIDGLLVIRLILKLLGANPTAGFSNWVYNVTAAVMPDRNMMLLGYNVLRQVSGKFAINIAKSTLEFD